jgi:hypothetical protein
MVLEDGTGEETKVFKRLEDRVSSGLFHVNSVEARETAGLPGVPHVMIF